MGLETLIARRKARTPGTPCATAGVPEKPAQTLAGTPRTLGTPENDKAELISVAVAELARPAVVQGDEAAHDLWLAGTPIADLDHCRFCGSRISWQTDGMAFADGTAAHNRCYEAAVAAGRRWW